MKATSCNSAGNSAITERQKEYAQRMLYEWKSLIDEYKPAINNFVVVKMYRG